MELCRWPSVRVKLDVVRLVRTALLEQADVYRFLTSPWNWSTTVDWQDRIIVDPKILVGKPIIKGTRIAVEFLLELFAEGWNLDEILKNYPQLTVDDVHAALHYATDVLKQERVYPLTV